MTSKASGDDDIEFRVMLTKIGRRIDEYSLEELKYQCRDIIGVGRLEKVATTQGFFELLEERDEINPDDVEFLLKVLKNVDRIDLYKVVQEYSMTRSNLMTEILPKTDHMADHNNPVAREEMVAKSFPVDPAELRSEQTPNFSMEQLEKGLNNYASPFDTSGDTGGGFHISHGQPRFDHRDSRTVIPAELQHALDFVINTISRGWQSAARHLDVPDAVIDNAEYNWPRDIRRQVGETFRYWARNGPTPSVQSLIAALRHIGRNDLADEIELGQY